MLQGCLNGARPADAHPALPVTPYYLARDARAVSRYGITSVHIHPRDPHGQETLDPLHVGDAVAAIHSEVPGMEVGVPAARWVAPDPRDRIDAVMAWGRLGAGMPDVISVNVHDSEWRKICAAAFSVGIGLELGVWTTADAVTLRKQGIPPGTVRIVAEPTMSGPNTAVAEAARIMRALGPPQDGISVLLHGEEDGAWPVLEYALSVKNIDTRIGFEDVLVRPDKWLATGNEDLVKSALALRP
ncbi:MAG TPA: 3-keto-5-aminohexanoate cleavage protein [Pseudonocardia sp.]|nr:3-keto-5-aminohexanoate cleavage protein [Pseudonocardia sp.]